jgi:hypothetical protein
MSTFTRRTRTVSFRLSEEEYQELRQVCIAHGIRSMSDFARLTTQWWIDADGTHAEPLLGTIRDLAGRLRELDAQVKQLSRRAPSGNEENLGLQVRAAASGGKS